MDNPSTLRHPETLDMTEECAVERMAEGGRAVVPAMASGATGTAKVAEAAVPAKAVETAAETPTVGEDGVARASGAAAKAPARKGGLPAADSGLSEREAVESVSGGVLPALVGLAVRTGDMVKAAAKRSVRDREGADLSTLPADERVVAVIVVREASARELKAMRGAMADRVRLAELHRDRMAALGRPAAARGGMDARRREAASAMRPPMVDGGVLRGSSTGRVAAARSSLAARGPAPSGRGLPMPGALVEGRALSSSLMPRGAALPTGVARPMRLAAPMPGGAGVGAAPRSVDLAPMRAPVPAPRAPSPAMMAQRVASMGPGMMAGRGR